MRLTVDKTRYFRNLHIHVFFGPLLKVLTDGGVTVHIRVKCYDSVYQKWPRYNKCMQNSEAVGREAMGA